MDNGKNMNKTEKVRETEKKSNKITVVFNLLEFTTFEIRFLN